MSLPLAGRLPSPSSGRAATRSSRWRAATAPRTCVYSAPWRARSPANDVDILIDLDEGRSLLDLARFHVELEDLLGCDVDVAERVKPRLREQVEAEAVVL